MKKHEVFTTGIYFGNEPVTLYIKITDRETALNIIETLAAQLKGQPDMFSANIMLPGHFDKNEEQA